MDLLIALVVAGILVGMDPLVALVLAALFIGALMLGHIAWLDRHAGWRQKRVLGRYVHWRGEDRL